ncbi:hypothetical protein GJ496_005412 [Pomphorhynchus laevis]|nr:hypothetical protein GJ496_005412 [Pomphorhynchus laevis]
MYKRLFYVWDLSKSVFTRLSALDKHYNCQNFMSYKPLNANSRDFRLKLFGINSVETGLTPIYVILIEKILTKFYIFQIFSCVLWYSDEYEIYATCILLISALSISVGVYETMKSERDLHAVSLSSGYVQILINDGDKTVKQYTKIEELVPGDVIIVSGQTSMPCDAVLLDGNVLMDESKLTGESVPVTKTSITSDVFSNETIFDTTEHYRHVLFSGTSVIQTRFISGGLVRAVVIRTGFNTLRGELIRNILFPKPVLYEYEADVTRYIKSLAVIAIFGMLYTLILKIINKDEVSTIIKRCLDVITICVPPALPAALLTGIIYAQRRLKKEKIYCISPNLINTSGTVDTVVFDKTGTLTEDGLDLRCVLVCNHPPIESGESLPSFSVPISNINEIPNHFDMISSMATCHNLTRIHTDLAGDPIDLKMFEFTGWNLFVPDVEEDQLFENIVPTVVKSPDQKYELAILKSFPFSSNMQRMSVIIRNSNNSKYDFICKGSPEKIVSLCNLATVPMELSNVLNKYTKDGYRVIGIAKKRLTGNFHRLLRLERNQLETDLDFLGLIVLENKLKEETPPVIQSLRVANLKQIMCTGDNLLTSISVARNCKLIDSEVRLCTITIDEHSKLQLKWAAFEFSTATQDDRIPNDDVILEIKEYSNLCFALEGPVFSLLKDEYPDFYEMVLVRCAIFARMLPEQKQQLVESLKNIGYSVIMCGDGANDCGALKSADTGISLSTTEASVASPFTSMIQNISCVPKLIRDGRCSLVTSFGLVKFICMYSLIQFISISVLYTVNLILFL